MLTKEEYMDIIENLDFFYGDNLIPTAELRKKKSKEIQEKDLENFKQKINCLKQLINEHFEIENTIKENNRLSQQLVERIQELELKEKQWIETERDYRDELKELKRNPPLKFEELNERMWVWDNKTKSYIFVFKPLNWEPTKGLRYAHQIIIHSAEGYYMDFEENRFYRREVKDNAKDCD